MPIIPGGGQVIPGARQRMIKQPALTNPSITSAAGTPAATTTDVGAAFNQATLNNNFATLVAQINAITTALRNAGLMS